MDDERNYVAEVAVLDIESREPKPDAHCGSEGQGDKQRQSQDAPVRDKMVPSHKANQNYTRNEEINKTGNNGTGWDDEPRKVDLRDKIGIADETITGFSKGIGKELPGEHSSKYHDRIGHPI